MSESVTFSTVPEAENERILANPMGGRSSNYEVLARVPRVLGAAITECSSVPKVSTS